MVLRSALNFIKDVLEAYFKLYTLILINERISHKELQIDSKKKSPPSYSKTRKRSICDSFPCGKNLTLEKLKLIIFRQMYK